MSKISTLLRNKADELEKLASQMAYDERVLESSVAALNETIQDKAVAEFFVKAAGVNKDLAAKYLFSKEASEAPVAEESPTWNQIKEAAVAELVASGYEKDVAEALLTELGEQQ